MAMSVVVGLAACSGDAVTPPSVAPTATEAQSESADPESAAGRQSAFDDALTSVWSEEHPVDRQATIEALVDAGFSKDDMQATNEIDSVGGTVTNIEVAVRVRDECLVGQSGRDGVRSVIATPLSNGRCLIGDTPPID